MKPPFAVLCAGVLIAGAILLHDRYSFSRQGLLRVDHLTGEVVQCQFRQLTTDPAFIARNQGMPDFHLDCPND